MSAFGLDPSTARIGLARPDGSTTSITAHAGAADSWRRLHELSDAVERELIRWPDADVIVIEGPALHVPGRLALIRVGEVRAAAALAAFRRLFTIVEVAPTALKMVATGNGNAKKEDVVAAAIDAGATPRNHDEADAWWLHEIGRRVLAGEPVPESIAALPWPALTAERRSY